MQKPLSGCTAAIILMHNDTQRKKPGPKPDNPRSFPTGHVVGLYDPATYEIYQKQLEQQWTQEKPIIREKANTKPL